MGKDRTIGGTAMSVLMLLALLGTVILALVPFVPGAIEIARPRDNRRLLIDQGYVRNPRFFGLSFRAKVASALPSSGEPMPYRGSINLHRPETFEVRDQLRVPPGASIGGIVASLERTDIGRGAKLGDCYSRGGAIVSDRASLRALACDGDATLGQNVNIARWIDASNNVLAGEYCDLGQSASADGNILLREYCKFQRLWGRPIITEAPHAAAVIIPTIQDVVVFGAKGLSLPRATTLDQDLVVRGTLQVGAESVIRGDIKAHKSIVLHSGVRVEGNVVTRQDLTIVGDVEIVGNMFVEGNIIVGSRSRIGSPDAFKSVYAAGTIRLSDRVKIFGWTVAERGGSVG